MKLLFVANRLPYPPFRGDKLKIYNLARRLAKTNELHLITFIQDDDEYQYLEPLREIFTEIEIIRLPKWKSWLNCAFGIFSSVPFQVLYFKSGAFRKRLNAMLGKHTYDAIHVQHLRMSQYFSEGHGLPAILDLPDAFSLYWERRKTVQRPWYNRIFDSIESVRVVNYEKKKIPAFRLCLVCSQEDLAYLRKRHNANNLDLLPNGVDLETFVPNPHDYTIANTLLFTGNMDYAPNVDAVLWFCEDIFPAIRERYPAVKFIIAGQRPVKKVQALASEHVIITGFVPDISEEYEKATLVVAPLRFGAGTQNKVLEALAKGVPVVCTHIGFQGLGIRSGEGAILAPEKELMTEEIIRQLSDPSLREETGRAGQTFILQHFSWDAIAAKLERMFSGI